MKFEDVKDLIEQVSQKVDNDIFVVGSQALYGYTNEVPYSVEASMETDFILGSDKDKAAVDLEFGELSKFYREKGYHAHALEEEFAPLTEGWKGRANQNENLKPSNNKSVKFCSPEDLAASKLVVGREKDLMLVEKMMEMKAVNIEKLKAVIKTLPNEMKNAAIVNYKDIKQNILIKKEATSYEKFNRQNRFANRRNNNKYIGGFER